MEFLNFVTKPNSNYLMFQQKLLILRSHTQHNLLLGVQGHLIGLLSAVVAYQVVQGIALGHPADEARVRRERYDRVALYGEIMAVRVCIGL